MNTICKVSMMSVESLILNKSAQLTNAFQCELTSETFSNIESVYTCLLLDIECVERRGSIFILGQVHVQAQAGRALDLGETLP